MAKNKMTHELVVGSKSMMISEYEPKIREEIPVFQAVRPMFIGLNRGQVRDNIHCLFIGTIMAFMGLILYGWNGWCFANTNLGEAIILICVCIVTSICYFSVFWTIFTRIYKILLYKLTNELHDRKTYG